MKRHEYEHDTEELKSLAQDGLTIGEIAEELGASYDEARAALNRRGIKATRRANKTIRQKVQDMKPLDAVEYLLSFVDEAFGSLAGAPHVVDDYGFKLTACERRVLVALFDADGAALSKDALLSAAHFGKIHDAPQVKIVDVWICKIRRKIRGGPFEIKTDWGYGYRLEREAAQ